MSAISEVFKTARKIHFLVELDFSGEIRRWALQNVNVPSSTGDPRFFEAAILKDFSVSTRFDIRTPKYTIASVKLEIANLSRLQDLETSLRMDGATGKVYVWADGLTWEDIETGGCIFSGVFSKDFHDSARYGFTLTAPSFSRFSKVPKAIITPDAWPLHRTAGGAGSVAGKSAALVYGAWPKGIPLHNVDTTDHLYLAAGHPVKSVEADYNAGTVDVYDKNGSVIAPANYTVYTYMDYQGSPSVIFDFSGDQEANEPLTCSIQGAVDGSGEVTGTAGNIIEHPLDVVHHILRHSTDLGLSDIDLRSIKTARSLLPGAKFATLANAQTDAVDLINRVLHQAQCALVPRPGGRQGVMCLSGDVPPIERIYRDQDVLGKSVTMQKTSLDLVANEVEAQCALNPSAGQYESAIALDRTNNRDCAASYYQYGPQPKQTIQLPDVQDEATAWQMLNRYLFTRSFRHDLATQTVPWHKGFDVLEGDAALLSLSEGASSDGSGWSEEKCVLVQRNLSTKGIRQLWWRVNAQ